MPSSWLTCQRQPASSLQDTCSLAVAATVGLTQITAEGTAAWPEMA